MKINDLAEILGKTRVEVEDILNTRELVELNLSERKLRRKIESDGFRIYE
ncbi:MAG: hypothetical protein AABX33_08265 [Nanoarchaeota archaeon]